MKLSVTVTNPLSTPVEIKNLKADISDISVNSSILSEYTLDSDVVIDPGASIQIDSVSIWQVPAGAAADAYGIYISYATGREAQASYQTFFRVLGLNELTSFQIEHSQYRGLDVYELDGGLSAEYAVEKSIENLAGAVSHTWFVSAPGSGPNPVYATPAFLLNAVQQTADVYDSILGASKVFSTVIISTGIPSIPYISNVMQAPVLPLHFLASVNTEKEVQSILDYSGQQGLKCYATLGYDLSIGPAVAWIKLLDLPPAYLRFLQEHQVKNVLLIGESASSSGEVMARRVLNQAQTTYEPGSIYIMYPGNTPNDVATLARTIADMDQVQLAPTVSNIGDWESGIIPDQIRNFSTSARTLQGINFWSVTSGDLISLYDLSTYATLAFFNKNGLNVAGVALDPYLLGHPGYESWRGFIPFNYWQGNTPGSTAARLFGTTGAAIAAAFPQSGFSGLDFWVNSSRNCGGGDAAGALINVLSQKGLGNISTNDYTQDEVWAPSTGMGTGCEKVAQDLTTGQNLSGYRQWLKRIAPLTIEDLKAIVGKLPAISMQAR